jgi:outer membrane autotransporter protein
MVFNGQTLTDDNSYSGGTLGNVRVFRDSSLGAPNAPLGATTNPSFFSAGALTLQLAASIVSARSIGNLTVIADAETSSTFSGSIGPGEFRAGGSGDVTLTGPITSAVGIAEGGSGTLTVRSTYTGSLGALVPVGPTFSVSGGTLLLANSDLLNQRGIFQITGGTMRSIASPQTISLRKFSQTGGTLVLRQIASTQAESLSVDGEANLGGMLQIVPDGGYVPHSGDRFTVITSGGIFGRYDRIIGPTGFLMRSTLVAGYTGPASGSLTLQEVALADLASSPNGGSVAQAIMRGASAGLSGPIFGGSGVFFGGPPEQINGRDFDRLTPQRLQALRNVAFDQTSFLASSLDDWRAGGEEGRWHVFASAPVTRGNIAPTESTARARYDAMGVTAGVDYTRIEGFDFGALFSYQDADIHFDRSGSRGSARSAVPAIFAGYRAGAWDAHLLLGYGIDDYRTDRRVQIGSGFDETAHGATSGHSPFAAMGARYDLGAGALHFGPALDATYTHLGIDKFTERNAPDADLVLGTLKADSVRTDIGAFAAYQASDRLSAEIKLQWQHELAAGTTVWNADFAQAATGGFVTVLPRLKGNAVAGAIALKARLVDRISLFADYAIQASRIETAQRLTAGARVAF